MTDVTNNTGETKVTVNANQSLEEANVNLNFMQKLPFFSGAAGSGFIWSVIMSFLTFFWTDVLTVAPGLVATFLLVTKLWDAVNDPIVGYVSDKTQTRFGRYRPWILSFLPIALFGLLTFTPIPGLSVQGQGYFSLAMYFIYVIAYTCSEVPGQGLVAAVTTDFRSRGQVMTFRMCGSYTSNVIIGACFLPLVIKLGGMIKLPDGTPVPNMSKGFFLAVLIFTIIAIPLGTYAFTGVKERVKIPVEKNKLSDSFKSLKGNGPFWLFFGSFFVYGITSGTTSARMFYWTYNYGNQELMSPNITAWILGMAVGSIIYFFIVKGVKNKATPAVIFFIITGLVNLGLFFFKITPDATDNTIMIFHAITLLSGVVQGIAVTAMYGVLPDITEYTQWKYKYRISGFVSSILNCSYKWSLAIGNAVFVAVIGAFGYVAGQAQNETVLSLINVFLFLIPFICHTLAGIIMLGYKIDVKRLVEMRAEMAQRSGENL